MSGKSLQEIYSKQAEEKKKILDIAYNHYVEHQDLRIREIAEKAKIHAPVIYKLFGGKNGLILEITNIICINIKKYLLDGIEVNDHPLIKLSKYGVNYINLAIHDRQIFKYILYSHKDYQILPKNNFDNNIQYINNTLVESIEYLMKIIEALYVQNLTVYKFDKNRKDKEIEILTIIAWANVHGLAMLIDNYTMVESDFLPNIQDSVIEAFIKIPVLNPEIINNPSGDIASYMLHSLEIIDKIKINVNLTDSDGNIEL